MADPTPNPPPIPDDHGEELDVDVRAFLPEGVVVDDTAGSTASDDEPEPALGDGDAAASPTDATDEPPEPELPAWARDDATAAPAATDAGAVDERGGGPAVVEAVADGAGDDVPDTPVVERSGDGVAAGREAAFDATADVAPGSEGDDRATDDDPDAAGGEQPGGERPAADPDASDRRGGEGAVSGGGVDDEGAVGSETEGATGAGELVEPEVLAAEASPDPDAPGPSGDGEPGAEEREVEAVAVTGVVVLDDDRPEPEAPAWAIDAGPVPSSDGADGADGDVPVHEASPAVTDAASVDATTVDEAGTSTGSGTGTGAADADEGGGVPGATEVRPTVDRQGVAEADGPAEVEPADVKPAPAAAPPGRDDHVDTTVLERLESELAEVEEALAAIDAGDLDRSPLLTRLLAAPSD